MGFIDVIKDRARADKKVIVLPESEDRRTYEAAEQIMKEGIADIVIVGTEEQVSPVDGQVVTGAGKGFLLHLAQVSVLQIAIGKYGRTHSGRNFALVADLLHCIEDNFYFVVLAVDVLNIKVHVGDRGG